MVEVIGGFIVFFIICGMGVGLLYNGITVAYMFLLEMLKKK